MLSLKEMSQGRKESEGYSEIVSEREKLPSLVCKIVDQLLVFSILS